MPDSQHPLDGVLTDPRVAQAIAVSTSYVMRICNIGHDAGRRLVLSAISDPRKLAAIHTALRNGASAGLIGWIIRCRVIDRFRTESWANGQCPLPDSDDEISADSRLSSHDDDTEWNARAQLFQCELAELVRKAVERFAKQGPKHRAQVELLRSYMCDDVSYDELCAELGCTNSAIRGRVFKARRAFRRFLERHHPEVLAYRE